jgi:hypothetical protein
MMKSTIPRCYRDRARRAFPPALGTGEQRACLPRHNQESPLRASVRVVSDRVSRLKPLSPAWAKETNRVGDKPAGPVHRQTPVIAVSLAP